MDGGFDFKTEILTTEGWKNYENITQGMTIFSMDFNTGNRTTSTITSKYECQELNSICLSNKILDFVISPSQHLIYKHHYDISWKISTMPTTKLCGQLILASSVINPLSDYPISDDILSLVGWIISEGHFKNEYGAHKAIMLFQKAKTPNALEISALLSRLKLQHSIKLRKDGQLAFYIFAKDGAIIREKYIKTKDLPNWAFRLSNRQVLILLDSMMKGDGCWTNKNSGAYYSKNEVLIDKLHALLILNNIRSGKYYKKSGFTGSPQPVLTLCLSAHFSTVCPRKHIKKNNSKKDMWGINCFPDSPIIIRRGGKVLVVAIN